MKHRDRILAGTAIGILMAASSMSAHAMQAPSAKAKVEQPAAPIILAQAADDQEKKQPETAEEAPAQAEEQPQPQPAEPQSTEEAPAQPEPKAAEEAPAQPQAAEEEPAQPEPKAAEEAPAQPQAAEEKPAQPEPKAAEEAPEQPQAGEEAPAQPEPKAAEEAPAQPQAGEEAPAQPEPKAAEEAPAEPKAAEEEPTQPKAAEEEAAKPAPKATEGEAAEPKATEEGGEQAQPSDEAATAGEQQEQNAAPMLDSQKDAAQGRDREGRRDGEARRDRGDNDRNADRNRDRRDRNAERDRDGRDRDRAERRPDSDQAAQRDINVKVEDVQRLNDEEGRRIDRARFRDFRRREGAKVVEKTENRTLIQFNNQIIVQDNSHDRIRVDARDVYYEELPNQLRREVVVRPNGTKIITVRNSYGDIVSRTRVVNDRRYVLIYAGDDSYDGRWQDPAANLPPLQIDIPRSEYILEAEAVSDPDRYYQFLDQPPVVPVENLYTIDQVKYSARVRDMVRRVDLDTINFETGSADIARSELRDLQALATAIQRMIDENPAETFLIEGHTDAVGSAESNLILSDERAESVATALTSAYDIPPENLFTQGYGEQYLKIDTEGAARENRRVAVRRITPLVSPVASAQK